MTPNNDIIKEFDKKFRPKDIKNLPEELVNLRDYFITDKQAKKFLLEKLEMKDVEWSRIVGSNLSQIYCSAKHIVEEAEELFPLLGYEINNDEIKKTLEPLNHLTNLNKEKE